VVLFVPRWSFGEGQEPRTLLSNIPYSTKITGALLMQMSVSSHLEIPENTEAGEWLTALASEEKDRKTNDSTVLATTLDQREFAEKQNQKNQQISSTERRLRIENSVLHDEGERRRTDNPKMASRPSC
jgi:predicted phosphoribosyltransferase